MDRPTRDYLHGLVRTDISNTQDYLFREKKWGAPIDKKLVADLEARIEQGKTALRMLFTAHVCE